MTLDRAIVIFVSKFSIFFWGGSGKVPRQKVLLRGFLLSLVNRVPTPRPCKRKTRYRFARVLAKGLEQLLMRVN